MNNFKTFETERLFLRPCLVEDAAFIYELVNSPNWLKYIGDRNIKSHNDAEKHIKAKMYSQIERLGFGNYTVIRKKDGAKMGTCGLHDRDGLKGIDIGFAFLPEYEGKGYAFEAAERLKIAAFEDFLLDEIIAITLPDNLPSKKLLEKIGLSFSQMIKLPNDSTDLMLYRLKRKSNKNKL
jgi:RimJ/RimL family protein N-acetyltransferase